MCESYYNSEIEDARRKREQVFETLMIIALLFVVTVVLQKINIGGASCGLETITTMDQAKSTQ